MKNLRIRMTMGLLIVTLCSGQGIAKEPIQPVTIRLNWVTNVQFAGILLAKERGRYEEAGIDLTIRGWEAGLDPIEEVIAGKAQIGMAEGANMIKARSERKKISAIAVQFQKSPFCLISKKNWG